MRRVSCRFSMLLFLVFLAFQGTVTPSVDRYRSRTFVPDSWWDDLAVTVAEEKEPRDFRT